MFKCLNCGHMFEDGEEKTLYEETGEKFKCCPICRGDYEQVDMCNICKQWEYKENLSNGFCCNCIKEFRYDWKTCLQVCGTESDSIKINALLASVFSESEIFSILYKELLFRSHYQKIDCDLFISNDLDFFTKRLKEIKGW